MHGKEQQKGRNKRLENETEKNVKTRIIIVKEYRGNKINQ